MASLSALAAAIRERLLAEEPAPLPGFGTLRRVHLPARVETRADGSKALQPPRESLRLVLGATEDSSAIALALARQLGVPVAQGRAALKSHVDQLEALLSARGDVPLEGVGIVRRTDRGILFGADPGLLATINASFEGLTAVGASPEASGESEGPETVEPEPDEPDATSDEGVGTVLSEVETSEPETPDVLDGSETDLDDIQAEKTEQDVTADAPEATSLPEPPVLPEPPLSDAPEEDDELDLLSLASPDSAAETLAPDADSISAEPLSELAISAALPFEVEVGPLGDVPYTFTSPEASGASVDAPEETVGSDATEQEEVVDLDAPPYPPPTLEPDADREAESDLQAEQPVTISAASSDDPTQDPAGSDVDELLAGIWAGGTPVASGLLGSAPALTDSSSETPPSDEAPIDAPDSSEAMTPGAPTEKQPLDELFTPEIGPLSQEAPLEPRPVDVPLAEAALASAPLVPPVAEKLDWSSEAAASVATGTAKRREEMAAAGENWTPYEEPPAYAQPEKRSAYLLPWLLLVVVAALAAAAYFLWRPETVLEATPAVTAADPAPLAPEASALDDSLAAADLLSDSELDSLAAAVLAEPATDYDSDDTFTDAEPASRPAETVAAPEAPREAAPTPAAPASSLRGTVGAPNVSGLPQRLAAGLAGDDAIQLGARGYTWVVTSISKLEDADRLAARYRQAGFRSRVIEGEPGGRTTYRVTIGFFDTQANALLVRDRLPADIRDRDDIWTLNLADL